MRERASIARWAARALTRHAAALALFVTVVAALVAPSVASAHVPWVESGSGTGPYTLDSPDVSRAVYARLGKGESDTFTFTVDTPVTTRIELLVPSRPALRSFYPNMRLTDPNGLDVLGTLNRDHAAFYEPFSLSSFWTISSIAARLEPGRTYTLTVSDVVGAPGPYVLAFGGAEAFTTDDIAETLRVLPTIWLGAWGGGPVRPPAVALLTIFGVIVVLMLVWVAARLITSRGSRARP